ncbi:MAG TPA: hypothetical protein PK507_03555 [bacterium]|nr:hypothetical protein [bacterium]
MKSKQNLLTQLNTLPYFTKVTVLQLCNQLNLKASTADTYISRFLKYGEIIKLKRGFYVTKDFFDRNVSDISYTFYLANVLYRPSYISLWTALQYYDIATEAIYSYTSVTTKVTRKYTTKIGGFSYRSIAKPLYTDMNLVKGKFDFFIASPSKALFDIIYFRTNQFRSIKTIDDINFLIDDLRIEIDEMDSKERDKFYNMIKKYKNI